MMEGMGIVRSPDVSIIVPAREWVQEQIRRRGDDRMAARFSALWATLESARGLGAATGWLRPAGPQRWERPVEVGDGRSV